MQTGVEERQGRDKKGRVLKRDRGNGWQLDRLLEFSFSKNKKIVYY